MIPQLTIPYELTQTTRLIGRDRELGDLMALVSEPECRLLTLVGPGGSGKTRLAVELAQRLAGAYGGQVHIVSLQPVATTDALVSALAAALGIVLTGAEEARLQLFDYFKDRRCLLILDNFEHPLDAAELLSDLLAVAPFVRLVVTSREALSLREEWLYGVRGLDVPDENEARDPLAYDAVRLFVEHARRVRHDFSFEREREAVLDICRAVEGLPLALELAASWLKALPASAIGNEIRRNVDFLKANRRNLPERHRSMRAVFEQSCAMLTPHELSVLMRLSLFVGGFDRAAAEAVAGASLADISLLVDKSLLQPPAGGRYRMHELLRQYARRLLEEDGAAFRAATETFCRYFAGFVSRLELAGGDQHAACIALRADLENLRFAFELALVERRIDVLRPIAYAFNLFFDWLGYYNDAETVMERALAVLGDDPSAATLVAEIEAYAGWPKVRLGRIDQAHDCFASSRRRMAQLEHTPIPGLGTDPLAGLTTVALIRGDYEEAARLAESCRTSSNVRGDAINEYLSTYMLSDALFALGDVDQAEAWSRAAYKLAVQANDRWFAAYSLSQQGHLATAHGDYAAARRFYRESFDIRRSFGDPEGMALALGHMGRVTMLEGDLPKAEAVYLESLRVYRQIHDRGGLVTVLEGLGRVRQRMFEYREASVSLGEALQIAVSARLNALALSVLLAACELMAEMGGQEEAVEVAALVLSHPSGNFDLKHRARSLLDGYRAELSEHVFEAAFSRGEQMPLEAAEVAVPRVLDSLLTALEAGFIEPEAEDGNEPARRDTFPDALTERELEILRLLASGMTNQQIAEKLVVVLGTVKAHNHRIFSKLGVTNRVQAVARARELNLL